MRPWKDLATRRCGDPAKGLARPLAPSSRLPLVLVGMLLAWPARAADTTVLENDIAALTAQASELKSRGLRATASAASGLRTEAKARLDTRALRFESLIRDNPARAIELAMPASDRAEYAAWIPDAAALIEERRLITAPAESVIVDDEAMARAEAHLYVRDGGRRKRIYTAAPADEALVSAKRLTVNGVILGDAMAGGTVTAADRTLDAAATSCSTLGDQKTLVVLVDFPGVPLPVFITPSYVDDIVFGAADPSLTNYWKQASRSRTSASGRVVGPVTLDRSYPCDEYYAMADAAVRLLDPTINFQDYTRVVFVFARSESCSWAGMSNVGCRSVWSPGDGTFTASETWILSTAMSTASRSVWIAAHELGHALGLSHSSSRDHGVEPLGSLTDPGTLNEYGDHFSAMGTSNMGQYAAQQMIALDWFTAGVNTQNVSASGTYSLVPANSPSGLKAIRVQRGSAATSNYLWIEYRQPVGAYESTLNPQVFTGALIHYQDPFSTPKTHLLDFTPATVSWDDPALAAGSSWSDPYSDLSLRIVDATPSALTVEVLYGSPPTDPIIALSKSSLAFSGVAGGASPASQTLSVSNSAGGTTLNWTASSNAAWLSLTPVSGGNGPTTVTVSVNTTGLSSGTYTGTLSFRDPAAMPPLKTVSVTLTVAPPPVPALNVSATALTFTGTAGGANPGAQTVSVSNSVSGTTLNWTASSNAAWLSLAPASGGNGPTSVSVSVNTAGLSTGTYTGTLTFRDPAASPPARLVNVVLTLSSSPTPLLVVSPVTLSFGGTAGGANPAAKTVTISNSVSGSVLAWTASPDAAWLSASPASGGNGPTTVSVSARTTGLSAGTYTGLLTINGNASNSPRIVTVTLTLTGGSGGGGGTVPPPDLSGLNGRTFGMHDEIFLNYPSAYSGFNWQLSGGGAGVSAYGRVGDASGLSSAAGSGVIGTSAPRFLVSDFGVLPGNYTLQVQVVNGAAVSSWASANILLASGDLAGVNVYPNPWRSDRHSNGITFGNLPPSTTVKVFTTSGHLARELSGSGSINWDLKNASGDTVASGIYLYLVTDSQGNKTKGKLAIIR